MAVGVQQQQRRDTEANWAISGKILAAGEIGYATDSHIIKIGDGVNTWENLTIPYDGRYLPIGGKAADSEMLDGISSGGFVLVGDATVPATADKIAKRDSSGRLKAVAGTTGDELVNYSQLTSENVSRSVTAAFTLAASDVGKVILVNNSVYTPFALNVPLNSAVAIPVGSYVDILVADKGHITITPATGVTVFGPLMLFGGGSSARLIKTGTDGWIVTNVSYSPGPIVRRKIKTGTDNNLNNGAFVKLRLDGANSGGPTGLYSNNADTLGTDQQWSAVDNYKVYCRRPGWYATHGQLTIAETGGGRFYLQPRINNVEQHLGQGTPGGGIPENTVAFSALVPLNLNDYIELWAYQDAGGIRTPAQELYAASFFEWEWRRPL